MKFRQQIAGRAKGLVISPAQLLLVGAGFVKADELFAITLAQRPTPDGLDEQNNRLVPGMRDEKAVALLTRFKDGAGRQDGKRPPAHFGFKINADEIALGIPEDVGIIYVPSTMHEAMIGSG